MLEDPFAEPEEERAGHRRFVSWLALLLALVIGGAVVVAHAEPVAEARSETTRIVLHSDKCALKEVANLPRRATWEEGGKVYEGCWGGRPDSGMVLAYFSDRTVVAIPLQVFQALRSS